MYYFLALDKLTPVQCTLDEWLIFESSPSHFIAQEFINGMKITTRFCGIDHFPDEDSPFLYETTISGGLFDGEELRYDSRQKAMQGHVMVCQSILNTCL